MHEPLLAMAALPAPATLCGIPLRPYSLGHELFLIRERNGFSFDYDDEGRPRKPLPEIFQGDVFEALWICSSTWEECRLASSSWLYLPKLWLLRRRVRKCNVALEAQAFRDYRDAGSVEFPLSQMPHSGRGSLSSIPGAPWLLRLHHFLCTQYRLTIQQAWDFPLGEAKMRWGTFYEQEGGLHIASVWDDSFASYVAKREAEKSAGTKGLN